MMGITRKIRDVGCGFIVIILLIATALFLYFRSHYSKAVNTSYSDSAEEVEVIIAPGDSVLAITEKLIDAGVLSNAKMPDGRYVFQWYLTLEKTGSTIQAGKFMVAKNLNMPDLVEALKTARTEDLWVKILEGKRIEEIADAIDVVLNSEDNIGNSTFDKDEFILLAKTRRYDEFEFMQYIPEGKSLEGFLFPDSYLVERDSSTEYMLKLLLRTFDRKIYQPYKAEISNNKYSLYELMIFASMVERESRVGEERAMVADIMFRRLETAGWRLEIDATLQYGLGWSDSEQVWWRQNLPARKTPNDYNTSVLDGLPPGPICSPSVSSFEATLRPVANDYWFYLHEPTGQIHFSKTLGEHESKRIKYLQ